MRKSISFHILSGWEKYISWEIFLIYNSTESQINKVEVVKVESYSRNTKARDHRETKVHEEYKSDQVSHQPVIPPWCSTAPPSPCSPWPSDSGPRSPPPPSPSASPPGWPPAPAPQLRCPIAPLVRIFVVNVDMFIKTSRVMPRIFFSCRQRRTSRVLIFKGITPL